MTGLDDQQTASIIVSLIAPALVVVAIIADVGGQQQKIHTLTEEVKLIRLELRERTKDRIYNSQHMEDIRRIEERLSRNEAYIFGFNDGGTTDKRAK